MTPPPFGISDPALVAAYFEGYADAGPALPTVPTVAPQPVDKQYVIGGGSSLTTLSAALTQAQKDGARNPRISYAAGGTYTDTTNVGPSFNSLTFDATGTGAAPLLLTPDNAINFIRVPNVQIRGLNFKLNGVGKQAALYFNSCPNVLLDTVTVTGFQFGIQFDGNGNAGIRIYRTSCLFQDSGSTNDSSGLYIQGIPAGDTAEIGGLLTLHCGWPVGMDLTNQALINSLARKHSFYANESPYPPTGGNLHVFNSVLVDGASRGIGSRHGGVYENIVFRSNGTAADMNVGNATYPGGSATIRGVVCFGPAVDGAPYWGGGIEAAPYTTYDAHDIYGFSNSTSQQNPLFTSFWDANPINPEPGNNAGNGPMPAGTSGGALDGIHGVWPKAAVSSFGGRAYPVATNNDVRMPRPGESLPSLESFYGVSKDGLYAILQSRGAQDAACIVDWCKRSWRAMNSPITPPVSTPAVTPAPFTVTLQIDPSRQTVSIK